MGDQLDQIISKVVDEVLGEDRGLSKEAWSYPSMPDVEVRAEATAIFNWFVKNKPNASTGEVKSMAKKEVDMWFERAKEEAIRRIYDEVLQMFDDRRAE